MATYRRRTILINRPFQLRFSAYVCGWILALCFIYPLIVSNLFEYFIRYVSSDPANADIGTLNYTRTQVLTLLGITEIVFLALTFLMSLFISHRIAGPLFKLRKFFEMYGAGTLRGKLFFRKKDYFPELADDFNRMIAMVQERDVRENEILATAVSRIESAMKSSTDNVKSELETALISIKKLQEQRTSPAASSQSDSDTDSET